MFIIAFSQKDIQIFRKIKIFFFKLTIEEYNFYNNSFGFIIPDSCDNDICQSFFSFCRGKGARPYPPPLVALLIEIKTRNNGVTK